MGWTPKRTDDGTGSDVGSASPTPSRRRKRRTDVVDAGTSDTPLVDEAIARSPRTARGTRPRGGIHSTREEHVGEQDDRVGITFRLGKRWSEIILAVRTGEYTWAEFVEGLDEEELARGQLKDINGGFRGRPPAMVPREFLLACQREMKRRFEELFSQDVLKVAKQYLELAQSKNLKPEVQAKMLQYAMERVFGGIPKDVRVSAEQPWEQMVVNVMRGGDDSVPEHVARRYAGYQERTGGGVSE